MKKKQQIIPVFEFFVGYKINLDYSITFWLLVTDVIYLFE